MSVNNTVAKHAVFGHLRLVPGEELCDLLERLAASGSTN